MYKAEEFVCLNKLISGTGSNWKIIFLLDSLFIKEGMHIGYITNRRPIEAREGAQMGILRYTMETKC